MGTVRDTRSWPQIPTSVVTLSLFLGAALRAGSLLAIEHRSHRRGWQRLVGATAPLTDDTLAYVLARYRLEDLRQVLVACNRKLKADKQFESAKIGGLLVVALDANEQFKSRRRCCPQCCQRRIKVLNAEGQPEEVTEYYHRQVYAAIHGPKFSTVLDLEPIRPGEEEVGAARRLLGRLRRLYGVRFFDAITVDAWYTQGPFLRVVQRLGWGVVTVLKQERLEVYQEATALSQGAPTQQWTADDGRQVTLREVKDLPFTDARLGAVRVVVSDEAWSETHRVGDRRVVTAKESHWRWLATRELDAVGQEVIWAIGHRRWGIENHTFNELTQHYALEHCAHHDPVAIVAWLLLLILGQTLFEIFVQVHGPLWRAGRVTLKAQYEELVEALGRWEELLPLWSG